MSNIYSSIRDGVNKFDAVVVSVNVSSGAIELYYDYQNYEYSELYSESEFNDDVSLDLDIMMCSSTIEKLAVLICKIAPKRGFYFI